MSKPEMPSAGGASERLLVVGRDPADGSVLVLDGGRAASFKLGTWEPGIQFDAKELVNFRPVTSPQEVEELLEQAQEALRKSVQ